MKESELQAAVFEAAGYAGWMVAHFRTAMTQAGNWLTPVAADGKGFPDAVMVHPRKGTIFAEFKSARGRVGPEQQRWHDALRLAGQRVEVIRPTDLEWFVEELTKR